MPEPAVPDMPLLRIEGVAKSFGNFRAVDQLSLDIRAGEFFALLGPSGCGKTTLLRIIAGLETADQGTIAFSGADITHVHVRERQVGFVFQHYALFRHMTVFENIAFGLRIKPRSQRPSTGQIKTKVMDLLRLVQLDWIADRYPSQLSGGQRQRIALARALYGDPFLVVLDEPNSNLDSEGERALIHAIARVRARGGIVVVIAHRPAVLQAVDHMLVLNEG
ncbi:MAG: ATP-binding cassette domain-containing protein, partial [Bradyrhizobium sp.]